MLNLRVVVAALDGMYPPTTAMSWDRVGLVTGDVTQPVRRVHFAVDATLAVITEARDAGADLLVTHHPLLLKGIHTVATTTAKGRAITALVVADVALYVAHTNADVASPGVCDALAAACGLTDVRPMGPADETDASEDTAAPRGDEAPRRDDLALGRVGRLPAPETLRAFAARVAQGLPATPAGIRVAGPYDAVVQTVAVVGGAGDDQFDRVRASGADVYVTADLRHHPALEAREEAAWGPPYLLDAGHWASEWVWLASAAQRLRRALGEQGSRLKTHISTLRTDPWDFTVGATHDLVPGGTP